MFKKKPSQIPLNKEARKVTRQITIKLNYEKFKPLLKNISDYDYNTAYSDSECVGRCIFAIHKMLMYKNPLLDNLTAVEYLDKKIGVNKHEAMIHFLKEFKDYVTNGNHKKLLEQEAFNNEEEEIKEE